MATLAARACEGHSYMASAYLAEVSELVSSKKDRSEPVEAFIAERGKQDGLIAEFDERRW